jgi:hypothetical protein
VRRKLAAAGLCLLPLGAFLLGPALAEVAPEDTSGPLLLSWLPTVLPLAALGIVAVLAYRRSRSFVTAAALTTLSFVIALIGAVVYLAAAWPTES